MVFALLLTLSVTAQEKKSTTPKVKSVIEEDAPAKQVRNSSDTLIRAEYRGVIKVDTIPQRIVLALESSDSNDEYNPTMWIDGYVVSRYVITDTPQPQKVVVSVKTYNKKWQPIKQEYVIMTAEPLPKKEVPK